MGGGEAPVTAGRSVRADAHGWRRAHPVGPALDIERAFG